MNALPTVRFYQYVNHPYEKGRRVLQGDPAAVFGAAAHAAESRARGVAAALHVQLGGVEVGAGIDVEVEDIRTEAGTATAPQATRLRLSWEAARNKGVFPAMRAELAAYPLTARETQLDFSGEYRPPLGTLGRAVDALLAHKLAEAAVHRFLDEIAGHLKDRLANQGIQAN